MMEVSELIGLQVYTKDGVFIGTVDNIILDLAKQKVYGLFIGESNPLLVEGGYPICIPYRWVRAVGDIILLRYFPKKIKIRKETPLEEELIA